MAKVKINTNEGEIIVRLYDETPLHRDNFLKLAKDGYFNETLFHRVIRDFMIQGGDPESKGAPKGKSLGTGGPGYTIPAEIDSKTLFHKRGALSAARLGDEVNPLKESSGSQFYIVWGKKYNPSELRQLERQMEMQQEQNIFNSLVAQHREEILALRKNRDRNGLMEMQEKLGKEAMAKSKEMGKPSFSDEQTKTYTEIGGTPFLDGGYTVFGEVESGIEVIEKIQNTATDRNDRPTTDICMTISIVEE